ncbi:MAG: YezD family protein [Armatimonadetes bacterium]|nr:YezD family protein [Armatimonadota bacterium]
MNDKPSQRSHSAQAPSAIPLEAIQEAVESIRYGVVQLIIQDGRVIQIDKTEKIRLA